jgi:hypothetical protein
MNGLNKIKRNKMKQTAVEQFIEQLEKQGESWENMSIGRIQISIKVEDYINLINQAKEMEKQQKGFSDIEVELIANEIVNWTIDNIGNPNPQSGKKFDEIMSKFKNK